LGRSRVATLYGPSRSFVSSLVRGLLLQATIRSRADGAGEVFARRWVASPLLRGPASFSGPEHGMQVGQLHLHE